MRVRPVYIKNKFKNLWVMWVMWAIKNFVCSPSAAVALWPGPSLGAIDRKPKCHAASEPGGQRAGRPCGHAAMWPCGRPVWPAGRWPCAFSTLVGGNVGNVHTTRWLAGAWHVAMWPCGHARALVDNVDNVGTRFQSLAKWGGCEHS